MKIYERLPWDLATCVPFKRKRDLTWLQVTRISSEVRFGRWFLLFQGWGIWTLLLVVKTNIHREFLVVGFSGTMWPQRTWLINVKMLLHGDSQTHMTLISWLNICGFTDLMFGKSHQPVVFCFLHFRNILTGWPSSWIINSSTHRTQWDWYMIYVPVGSCRVNIPICRPWVDFDGKLQGKCANLPTFGWFGW